MQSLTIIIIGLLCLHLAVGVPTNMEIEDNIARHARGAWSLRLPESERAVKAPAAANHARMSRVQGQLVARSRPCPCWIDAKGNWVCCGGKRATLKEMRRDLDLDNKGFSEVSP